MDHIELSVQFRRETSDLVYPDHSTEFSKSEKSFQDFAIETVDWFTAHERRSTTVRRIRGGEVINEYISPDPKPEQ